MNLVRRAYRRLLRLSFHLLYNEMAWTYDAIAWAISLGDWGNWVRSILPFVPETRVLEIALGTGNLLIALQSAGVDAFGLDLSPHMLRIARCKLHQRGVNAPLVRGSAFALPFAAATFGAVVSTFPTEFIYDPQTLSEIRRVLTPNGRLIVLDEAVVLHPTPVAQLIGWLYRITGQHPKHPSPLVHLLHTLGWQVEECETRLARSAAHLIVADTSERNFP